MNAKKIEEKPAKAYNEIMTNIEKYHADSNLNMAVMLELQENDRRRIARDLHDITVQELVHIIQKTELCMKYLNKDNNRVNLELASIIQSLRNAIDGARSIIYDLRPMNFDDFGFSDAIQRMADDMMSVADFVIQTDIDNFENTNNYKDQYISLYRIVVELVRNSIYHSEGNKIIIRIKIQDDFIFVHVIDNGKGFDPNHYNLQENFGLQIVRNRLELLNGNMNIKSDQNGTDVEIKIRNWESTDDRSNVD